MFSVQKDTVHTFEIDAVFFVCFTAAIALILGKVCVYK